MAEAQGKLTRPAGHLLRHPRAGREQRRDRHPHRVPGLDADGRLHRPGGERAARPRGLPGGRLPADVRPGHARLRQVGRRDPRRRPAARVRRPRLPHRDAGPAGAGGAGPARGHAARARRRRRCCRASSRRWPRRRPRRCAALRELLAGAERPFVIAGGSGWTRGVVRGAASASPSAGSCRSAAPSASRTCSTTAIRTTPATSASASIRSSPRASREADLVLAIGPRLGEMTTGGYTLLTPPRPTQKLVHVHAGAEELGRVYAGRAAAAVVDGLRRAGAGDARSRRRRRRWADWTRAAARRLRGQPRSRRRSRRSTWPRSWRRSPAALPADTVFTNGAGNFSGWLHRFYRYPGCATPAGPSSRRPRARWATACRPPSPRPCSSRTARWSTSPATATS